MRREKKNIHPEPFNLEFHVCTHNEFGCRDPATHQNLIEFHITKTNKSNCARWWWGSGSCQSDFRCLVSNQNNSKINTTLQTTQPTHPLSPSSFNTIKHTIFAVSEKLFVCFDNGMRAEWMEFLSVWLSFCVEIRATVVVSRPNIPNGITETIHEIESQIEREWVCELQQLCIFTWTLLSRDRQMCANFR